MKRLSLAIAAACLMTGTAWAGKPDAGPHLNAKQARDLARTLADKKPGKPQSCVPMNRGSDGLRPIGDDILVYRINKNLVYRNDLNGSCSGLGSGETLVLKPTGGQYCRGDIAHVVDLSTGMHSGSCALGDFVPYTPAGG